MPVELSKLEPLQKFSQPIMVINRSGETQDEFIADFEAGLSSPVHIGAGKYQNDCQEESIA